MNLGRLWIAWPRLSWPRCRAGRMPDGTLYLWLGAFGVGLWSREKHARRAAP